MDKKALLAALCMPLLLGGCIKGLLPDPEGDARKVEDEAAATGAGCRQAGRSLEQCYMRNEGLNRNGALRGWREMDEYMRQNKLEPQLPSKEDQDKEAGLKDASKGEPEADASKPADAPKQGDATSTASGPGAPAPAATTNAAGTASAPAKPAAK